MRVLIAGGRGFLGTALMRGLRSRGHSVKVLTRSKRHTEDSISWDGKSVGSWVGILEQTDAVVNACGYGLEHWPWTPSRRIRFLESRVVPGRVLANAISKARSKPMILVQFSGVNRYGLGGDGIADEDTPPADDFLAKLTIPWEESTRGVEDFGVRRVVVRNAVVLDRSHGLFPLMCLPARLFMGGRLGSGRQVVPWIHIEDHVRALLFLLESEQATGAYNLVAPNPSDNGELMKAVCASLRRPYWLHIPSAPIRLVLGGMADLVLRGRSSIPRRLLEAGFGFEFPTIQSAVHDLLAS
jgi:uncharacterized protein